MKNTEKFQIISELTEDKIKLTRDLNSADSGVSQDIQGDDSVEKEERSRILAYIQLQAKEIESLRSEIVMLKRKDAPPISIPTLPPPPDKSTASGSFLPPIPNAKKSTSIGRI